jgi:hypothetical protein
VLIYLDSAHFDWLERASVEARECFFSAWRSVGGELALSLHHIQEIAQLDGIESLRRRSNVLMQFPVIRGPFAGSATVREWEVRMQLLELLTAGTASMTDSGREQFFPRVEPTLLADILEGQQELFHRARSVFELSSNAENLSKQAGPTPRRLPDHVDWEQLMVQAEEVIAQAAPTAEEREALRAGLQFVAPYVQRAGSARGAIIELQGLSEVRNVGMVPDANLTELAMFVGVAREIVAQMAAASPRFASTLAEVLPGLDLFAAPGTRLRAALHRARMLHPRKAEPGDQLDEDHVVFAPYVDVLFADKRTVSFLQQESRDRPLLLRPASIANVLRAKDLTHTVDLISTAAAR